MTNREFFVAVANAENIDAELIEFAAEAIVKMDHANEARREKAAAKAAEKAAEKDPIRNALLEVIGAEPMTASQLIELAGLDIKPASVPSLLKPFVEDGTVSKVDVKVAGKGTARGYVKA